MGGIFRPISFKEYMRFSRIVGQIDKVLISLAEGALSELLLDLGSSPVYKIVGTKIGGDPYLYALLQPVQHIADEGMKTAGTDGRYFYWAPSFILRVYLRGLLGLRILGSHEGDHAIYLHPARRGWRHPKLWNACVDYKVHANVFNDLKVRGKTVEDFKKHLGKFVTVPEYSEFIKNPFKGLRRSDSVIPEEDMDLQEAFDKKKFSSSMKKFLEADERPDICYFADPELTKEHKRPENLYDYFHKLLPRCPKCKSIGIYFKPQLRLPGMPKRNPNCCDDDCNCKNGIDIFKMGPQVMDEHLDTEEQEEKLAKRIHGAIQTARQMAGHAPAGIEEELGFLTASKVRWKNKVRLTKSRISALKSRNDFTQFKTRPMFAGMMIPKKQSYETHVGILADHSGSMSPDDSAFGVSQLQSLDPASTATYVPADAIIYWEKAVKLKSVKKEELQKLKMHGRGGTLFASFFDDYEKKIGKCDILIVITDGYLDQGDIAKMNNPGVPVFWLITSNLEGFKPPFGEVYYLRDA